MQSTCYGNCPGTINCSADPVGIVAQTGKSPGWHTQNCECSFALMHRVFCESVFVSVKSQLDELFLHVAHRLAHTTPRTPPASPLLP